MSFPQEMLGLLAHGRHGSTNCMFYCVFAGCEVARMFFSGYVLLSILHFTLELCRRCWTAGAWPAWQRPSTWPSSSFQFRMLHVIPACDVSFVQEMLDCWRMAGLAAPINVAFMFEGEEENGSLGFQESVADNLDWFKDAVLVVISNTVWVGENKPCLTYGMRGMVTASLVVSCTAAAAMLFGVCAGRAGELHELAWTYTQQQLPLGWRLTAGRLCHMTLWSLVRRVHRHCFMHVTVEQAWLLRPTIVMFLLKVSGPARDLHSGNEPMPASCNECHMRCCHAFMWRDVAAGLRPGARPAQWQ
jgi:hypothetical protein